MNGVVVVGAGLGGLRTAESLRANGFAGPITIIGDEEHLPYNRPPLSKEALSGQPEFSALEFRRKDNTADVEWKLGCTVVSADLDHKRITTSTGESIPYDALVIATGVTARRLPVDSHEPSSDAGRHIIRTLNDALILRPLLRPGARVVVLGAGFIGCEAAATARGLGCEVSCVALDPLPMIRPLGVMLATELQRRLEGHGITFHLSSAVDRLIGDSVVTGVQLSDGTVLDADVVIEALGSTCNVAWLEGNGLDLSDGVLSDGALRPLRDGVPVDGVAVVGDVARFPNPRFDDRALRVEHWNVPTDTGRRAGAVLAAYLAGEGYQDLAEAQWEMLPSFWSDQFDIRLQSYGMPSLADVDGICVIEGDIHDECIVGYFRGDELIGVVGIGMLRAVNAYRASVGHPTT